MNTDITKRLDEYFARLEEVKYGLACLLEEVDKDQELDPDVVVDIEDALESLDDALGSIDDASDLL